MYILARVIIHGNIFEWFFVGIILVAGIVYLFRK